MIKYHAETTINQPVEKVFQYVMTVDNYEKWTEMRDNRLLTGGKIGVGSQFHSSMKMGPVNADLVFEVTEYEPNHRVAWKTVSKGPVDWDSSVLVERNGGSGTHLTAAGALRFNGLLRLLEPLMAGEVQKGEAHELVVLKGLLEGEA